MTTITDTGTPMPNVSNYGIIKRLLSFMKPFNGAMTMSLIARVVKLCGQAAVLGIAAASIGIYVQNSEPGVMNWSLIWTQVGWIAAVGVVVSIASYIEMYLGHYVAFHILMAFRNRFFDAIVPLAPAKTAKLQSGEAVGRVMTDCERIEPFYAHTIAPAIAAFWVPGLILAWCWTVNHTLVYALLPFYAANTLLLPWLVSKLGGDGVRYREQLGQVNAF
ncbi:MAG: ABC transporter transmembrane domain-containing protein, partial [Gammaproteobacteria bacterium]